VISSGPFGLVQTEPTNKTKDNSMLDLALKMLLGDRAKYIMLISGLTFASLLMTEQAANFCDEPTAALDSENGAKVMELLRGVATKPDRCVIIVTHGLEGKRRPNQRHRSADRVVANLQRCGTQCAGAASRLGANRRGQSRVLPDDQTDGLGGVGQRRPRHVGGLAKPAVVGRAKRFRANISRRPQS